MTFTTTHRLRALLVPVSFALGVAFPSAVRAQDAPSDEAAVEQRRADAKAKYQAGVEAYERKRYKDAVDSFLAADRLAPSAPLSFNIGRAYERLGDDSSALRWYRDYLRRSPGASNADSVQKIVEKLAANLAQKGVQQITIISNPAGATVSVDQQPVGVTPWTGDLAPGRHHVSLSLRGYGDLEQDLELSAQEPLDLALRLEPAAVNTSVPAADVPAPAPTPNPVTSAPSTPVAPPAPAPRASTLGVWPWVTLGVGAAALGGALAFEISRRSAEDDAKHEPTQLGFQSALDTMQSRKTTARVFLGVGAAAVVAGGVLAIVDLNGRRASTRVGFACLPGNCALEVGGHF